MNIKQHTIDEAPKDLEVYVDANFSGNWDPKET
jgi:hypothetical protein